MNKKDNGYYKLMGKCFIIMLCIMIGFNILIEDREFSSKENRMLTQMPKATIGDVSSGRFEKSFEKYMNDQFFFRTAWINLKITTDLVLGKNISNGVYLGKNGYLMQQFNKPNIDVRTKTINSLRVLKKKHKNIDMHFLIAPTSSNINKDKLPLNAITYDENLYIDNMYNDMKKVGIKPIDIRKVLNDHKDEDLYYHSDHHWTTKGAYYGYKEAAKTLGINPIENGFDPRIVKNDFEGALKSKSGYYTAQKDDIYVYFPKKVIPKSVVAYAEEREKSGSFYKAKELEKADAYTVFLGGNHSKLKISTAVKTKKKLLVLKDSYANCFLPFLATNYHEITVIDPRYYFRDIHRIIEHEEFTDILFLYNAHTLSEDTSLSILLGD
ncbi:MAG: DHHW family protein [Anaerovoracaceae bacterium]